MVCPASSMVATGDLVQACDHNTVRCDALTHTHCGNVGSSTIAATSFTGTATVSNPWTFVGDSTIPLTIQRDTALTAASQTVKTYRLKSSGTVADGFGPVVRFDIEGCGLASTAIGFLAVVRDGADNTGKMQHLVRVGGVTTTVAELDNPANGETSLLLREKRSGQCATLARVNQDATTGVLYLATGSGPSGEVATGTYTGDGTASQAVTCVGLSPQMVIISQRVTGAGCTASNWYTTTVIVDDNACGGAIDMDTGFRFRTNVIRSLDCDGFTVGNDNTSGNANSCGQVYNFIVWS